MIDWKLKPEEMKLMSLGRDLEKAHYKVVDKKTGEIEVEYDYTYTGTLEFFFETGMEGLASILHDDRGWYEKPSWNNETKKEDGPVARYKSLEWSTFIRGGEYLTVYDKDDKVIWEGLLLRDTEACAKQDYRLHFLPQRISYEDWVEWCQKEYKAEILTNEPVLAENEEYQEEQAKRKKEYEEKQADKKIEGDK